MRTFFNASIITFFLVTFLTVILLVATFFPISNHLRVVVVDSTPSSVVESGSVIIVQSVRVPLVGDIVVSTDQATRRVVTPLLIMSATGTPVVYTISDGTQAAALSEDRVWGSALLTVPYIGKIIDFVQRPVGFVVTVVLPLGVLVLEELLYVVSHSRKVAQKKKTSRILIRSVEEARKQQAERIKRKKMQLETTHKFLRAPKKEDQDSSTAT